MDRLHSWVGLTSLSIVAIGTLVDSPEARTGKENFALAAACISLIIGFFFIAAFVVESLRKFLIGNMIENAAAVLVLGLWTVAIAFIQNPNNGIATTVVDNQELILYANLYFFSWLSFLLAIYTVSLNFRDNFHFGPKFNQWVLLFTASIILLATAINLRGVICGNDGAEEECPRTKYAIGVGAIGMIISFFAVALSILDRMTRFIEIGATMLSSILYFFGVVFLTSTGGPASAMGNMYFSVWGGCLVSFVLTVGIFLPDDTTTGDGSDGTTPGRDEEQL